MIVGQDRPIRHFLDAWRSRRLHHAWLVAGPRGVGKASFAMAAARRVLADAADGNHAADELPVPDSHPVAKLLSAGSHPDFRLLQRLERPTGGLARNISVDQVRSLAEMLSVTPSLSPWRAIVIDAADDLEASAANALLKMLEEPPSNTLFFLVAHAPGRLLPTIRSRCRRLDFLPLSDEPMRIALSSQLNGASPVEIDRLLALSNGSVGRALTAAALDLASLESAARDLMVNGDADNSKRATLAQSLAGKASSERYGAFLEFVPSLIAHEARGLSGARRQQALDAYAEARETVALAPRLSLDPAATVFRLGTILAGVALKG